MKDETGDSVRDSSEAFTAETSKRSRPEIHNQLIIDAVPGLIAYIDREYNYVYVNRRYVEWFGLEQSEVVGRTMAEVLGEQAFAQLKPHADKALSGQQHEFESEIHYRTGGTRFIHASYTPDAADGRVDGFIVLVTDITESKQAERALIRSEERYRAFIRQSSEGIWRMEVREPIPTHLPAEAQVRLAFEHGYLAECNDAMARQYGYRSAGEITGIKLSDLLLPDDPGNEAFLLSFIENGYNLSEAESHEKDKDGNDRYFLNNFVGFVENGMLVRAWGTQRDITAAKAAESATAHLASIVTSSDDAIISKDIDGIVTSWNAGAERMFGYAADEIIGRPIALIVPPELQNEEAQILAQIRRGMVLDHFETVRVRKDGTLIDVSITVSPVRDIKGAIKGASKIARDITAVKAARIIADRYKLLSMRVRDVILFLHPKSGQIVEANQAAVDSYGYDHATLLSKTIRDLRAPETLDVIDEQYRIADAGGIQFETVHIRADGTAFPVEVSSTGADIGNARLVVSIIRDISERKAADNVLAQNQLMLTLAMRGSSMGAWEMDLAADTVWWSEELEAIFGLEKGAFDGTERHFYELMHEGDRETAWNEVQRAIVEKRGYVIEFRFHHADGSVRWLEGRGEAVYSQDGKPVRLYGVGIDITQRKSAEASSNFLSELAGSVQEVSEPDEVMSITARMLAEYLDTDRCTYAEVEDGKTFVITGDFSRGVRSLVGRWPGEAFGEEFLGQMQANETFVATDTANDPRIGADEASAYKDADIAAVICVPLHKNGNFTAAMAVHQKQPRSWSESEIELVQHTASRCWESLERARAIRSVRESDERFRLALSSGIVTVYEQDRDLRYEWVYPDHHYRPDVVGMTDLDLSPGAVGEIRTKLKQHVLETGESLRHEVSAVVGGNELWFDLLIEPRRDASGNIIGVGGTALNITERKKLQQSYLESEERFRGLIEQAPLSVQLFDPEGRTVRVNKAWETLWGSTFEQLEGYNVLADPQLEASGTAALLRRAFEGEAVDLPPIEYDPNESVAGASSRPDSRRWVSAVAYPLKGHDGSVREVALVHQDITERKLAENRERQLLAEKVEATAKFRTVFDQSAMFSGILSVDGIVIEANKACLEGCGYTSDQVIGKPFQETPWWRGSAEVQAKVTEGIRSAAGGKAYRNVLPYLWADGADRTVDFAVLPILDDDGEIIYLYPTGIDITERQRTEEALRESEARFRYVADAAPVLIWISDANGDCTWFNKPRLDFTGRPMESEIGRGWIDSIHPDDQERCIEAVATALRTREPYSIEYRVRRHDGEYRWLIDNGAPRFAQGGEFLGFIGSCIDITERKAAEDQRRVSDERYRQLFESIDQGACVFEMIFDADGRPIDYLFLETNPAFEKHTGLVGALGRTARSMLPDLEQEWIDRYGEVAVSGEPLRFTMGSDVMGRWFDVYAFRPGGPENRKVALLFKDITEERQTAERIRRSEERYRSIVDQTIAGIAEVDLDGKFITVNDQFAEMTGYSREELLDGLRMQDITHTDDLIENLTQFKTLLTSGKPFNIEKRHVRKDGSVVWISNSVSVLLDSEGKPNSVVVVSIDISKRKKVEERLRETEERFSKAFNSSPLVLTISSLTTGRLIEVNDTFIEITGYSRDEAVGKTTVELGLWSKPDDRTQEMSRIRETGQVRNIEYEFVTRTGRKIIGLLSAEKIEIGGEEFALTVIQDVTERKMAQEALFRAERRAADEYFELLSRIVPLAEALGTARDLITIYRAVRDFVCTGMPCSAFFVSFYDEATHLRTAAYVWGDDGGEVDISKLPQIELADDGGPNSQAVFHRRSAIVNSYMDVMKDRPHIVLQENGVNPDSALAVPMIVMDRVTGTFEVQAYESDAFQKEHVIALEMVANLAAVAIENVRLIEVEAGARHEAEAANRMKDEFLSILSHELRTPLNAMLGWVRMLRAGMLDEERSEKALEVIERNTRQQSSLIEDLLDVSRIISGKMRIEKELTDLTPIVRDACESLRPIAAAKGIAFEANIDPEPLPISGDSVRLLQVVTNLVQNAIKFTPAGGRVSLALSRRDGIASIVVSDSGVGIEDEFLPSIFDRFSQADASTRRNFAGLGLGLTIVRTIVKLHGGKISAESPGKDRGSIFTVTLPLTTAFYKNEELSRWKLRPDDFSELKGMKILLVDDDAESLVPVQMMLERRNADVICASSAREAMEHILSTQLDLLISDIGMPGVDGYQLIGQVRSSSGPNAGVRAIALTAYASADDREKAITAGFHMHLSKPVDLDALLEMIKRIYYEKENGGQT